MHKHCYNAIPEEARAHATSARTELRKSVEALFPPEFIAHRRKAHRHMLLAAQQVVNSAIERLEAKEKEEKKK